MSESWKHHSITVDARLRFSTQFEVYYESITQLYIINDKARAEDIIESMTPPPPVRFPLPPFTFFTILNHKRECRTDIPGTHVVDQGDGCGIKDGLTSVLRQQVAESCSRKNLSTVSNMTSVLDASTASFGMDMVPRQLLQDSQESVERLKRQLNDALSHRDGEVDIAVHTLQAQLRAMQKQHKTAEDQLNRSLAREKELREQVVNADMLTVISQLRRENKELREKNESLNEQATKGQASEAQIIALRNKLEASQEDLKRVRAGGMRELESTQEEVLALKRALELAQLDNIRNDQMMRQMNALEENMERAAEQLNEKVFQVILLSSLSNPILLPFRVVIFLCIFSETRMSPTFGD